MLPVLKQNTELGGVGRQLRPQHSGSYGKEMMNVRLFFLSAAVSHLYFFIYLWHPVSAPLSTLASLLILPFLSLIQAAILSRWSGYGSPMRYNLMVGFRFHWCLHSVPRCSLSSRCSIHDGMDHLRLGSIQFIELCLMAWCGFCNDPIYCERSFSDDRWELYLPVSLRLWFRMQLCTYWKTKSKWYLCLG